MTKRDLQERTKRFALDVLALIEELPRTRAGNIIAGQLGRAGTSVGANYRAACRARSKKEFVAKVGIVEEEADESAFWVELAVGAGVVPGSDASALWREADELTRIMAQSRITAAAGLRKSNRQSAVGNRQSSAKHR